MSLWWSHCTLQCQACQGQGSPWVSYYHQFQPIISFHLSYVGIILNYDLQKSTKGCMSSGNLGNLQKTMQVVLQTSKGNFHLQYPKYNLIDGTLMPIQRLSNVLCCADLLDCNTLPFTNLVHNVSIIFLWLCAICTCLTYYYRVSL